MIDILHSDPARVIPEEEVLAYMRLSSAWDPPTPGTLTPRLHSETRP